MGGFEFAVAAWRGRAFPAGSADDDLDELHADVALADSWVADAVIPYIDRGLFKPPPIDVAAELVLLRERASKPIPDQLRETQAAYAEYIDLLVQVYTGYLSRGKGGSAARICDS